MHITSFTKILILSGLLASSSLYATEVFQWKNNRGNNSYSDVPNNLRPSQSTQINMRTHKVVPPATASVPATDDMSLAEQQRALNDKIAQKNAETDKRNKEIEEANRKNRESSCKTARLNRSFAESLRTNREAAIQRYDADIAQFCN